MKSYTIIAGADDVGKRVYLNLMQAKPNSLGLVFCDLTSVYLVAKNPVQCMEKGYNFTVETTLLSNEAVLLAKMAKDRGYCVNLHFIGIDKKYGLCENPNENCEKQQVFFKEAENLKQLLPLCDNAVFVDNDSDFLYLAKYSTDGFTKISKETPRWLDYICKTVPLIGTAEINI